MMMLLMKYQKEHVLLHVPQIAFLKRCRDYAQVHKTNLSKDIVKKSLALLEIDELGLFLPQIEEFLIL